MQSADNRQLRPFFTASHWARLWLMALLAVVFVATTAQATWEMMRPEKTITGTVIEVAEFRQGNRSARYNLVLRDDEEEIVVLLLPNNGRVLNYLLAQETKAGRRITVWHRQGAVLALVPLDGSDAPIRESSVQPAIKLLIGLLALLILIFHVRPGLAERQAVADGSSRTAGGSNQASRNP